MEVPPHPFGPEPALQLLPEPPLLGDQAVELPGRGGADPLGEGFPRPEVGPGLERLDQLHVGAVEVEGGKLLLGGAEGDPGVAQLRRKRFRRRGRIHPAQQRLVESQDSLWDQPGRR